MNEKYIISDQTDYLHTKQIHMISMFTLLDLLVSNG